MVAGAYYLALTYGEVLPAIYGGHEAWRYTLLSGLIPAIPLILIRPFLPESPIWREKRAEGTLRRPSIAEIFQPAYRRTTIVTTIMMACTYAAAFGAIQQLPQMIPGLPGVVDLPVRQQQLAVAGVQSFQEFGGMLGRVLLAVLAVRILSRRRLIRTFLLPGVIITPLVFMFPATNNIELLKLGIFIVGVLTVGQMSFWGNYLPLVYPTHLSRNRSELRGQCGRPHDRHVRRGSHIRSRRMDAGQHIVYPTCLRGSRGRIRGVCDLLRGFVFLARSRSKVAGLTDRYEHMKFTQHTACIILVFVLALMVSEPALAQDWPQWRGPNRDGVVTSFREPTSWPESLNQEWKVEVGFGYATPILVGDRIYMHARQDEDEVMIALDAATGDVIWQTSYPAAIQDESGSPSSRPGTQGDADVC